MANSFVGNVFNPHIDFQLASKGKMKYTDTFRRFFGETEMNAEPHVSGFGVIFFTKLPEPIDDATNANYLTAVTPNVSLPDITLDSIDYEGRDGGQWHVPGRITVSNDLSMTMWELRGMPTYSTLARWITLMRNPIYGFMTDTEWRQANYKGRLMYCSCTPDLEVQIAKVYSGIWPTSLQDSKFSQNDSQQERIEYEVSFKFDHYPYSSTAINQQAQAMITSMSSQLTTIIQGKYEIAKGSTSTSFGTGGAGA